MSNKLFLRNYLNKYILKTSKMFFCEINKNFSYQNPQENINNKVNTNQININNNNSQQTLNNQFTENKGEKINDTIKKDSNTETPTEPKTRKEEVMFYIMHDKYSVRPDKEYRISHTTLESTNKKTKKKDLNVLYYGKN